MKYKDKYPLQTLDSAKINNKNNSSNIFSDIIISFSELCSQCDPELLKQNIDPLELSLAIFAELFEQNPELLGDIDKTLYS